MRGTALWAWRTAWIAACYFALGKPALLLADESNYASPIWPAAGFAVGVVYCYKYGYKACIGIALGSAILNSTVPMPESADLAVRAWVPILIGLGAATQAAVARLALVRCLGPATGLKTIRSALVFCGIAGPFASLINGFWGPWVLQAMGVTNGDVWLRHVWTWYVGDTLGGVIFAPATLALLSYDLPAWKFRAEVTVVVAALSVVTVFVHLAVFSHLPPEQFYNLAVTWLVILAVLNLAQLKVSAMLFDKEAR